MSKTICLEMISGEPRVFLRRVPDDLVLRFFGCFGYKTLSDEIIFRKNNITEKVKDYLDECILILFPYFRKNVQTRISLKMNELSYIRLLRNLAHNSSLILKSQQRTKSDKPYYFLINPNKYKHVTDEVRQNDLILNKPVNQKDLPIVAISSDASLRVDFE